jgi:Cyclic nucleotide-binding domain
VASHCLLLSICTSVSRSRGWRDVSLVPGEYAAHEGAERALFAVLEGRIEPTRLVDGIERVLGERHPGDVFGEVPIVLGTVFPVGFRAAEASRVMRIEAHDYHAVAAVVPDVAKEVGRLAAHRMGGSRGLQGIAAEPPPPRAIVLGIAGTRPAPSCGASYTETRSRSSGSPPTHPTRRTSGAAHYRPRRTGRRFGSSGARP